jgi:hemin uptake protein HemP
MIAASDKPRSDVSSKSEGAAAETTARSVRLVDNCVQSNELFAAAREVTIAHGADVYRLRLTSQNKLILTK